MVRIALDPVLGVQPGKNLLEEVGGIALGNAELSDPDGLAEGSVEVLEVGLEVLGLGPCVVVGDDKVDLAVAAAGDERLEPVDALSGLVAVGHSWGAEPEALLGKRLDVLAVSGNCAADVHVGASAADLIGLVEGQGVSNRVLLLGVGDVGKPTLGAPLLVGVEQGHVFEAERLAVDHGFPVVHP